MFRGNISVNERYDNFVNKIKAYHDIAFPISKSNIKNTLVKLPLITNGIRKSSETYEYLAFLNRTCNDEITRSHFKKYKTVFRKVIRKSKEMYNAMRIRNALNKGKEAWEIICLLYTSPSPRD